MVSASASGADVVITLPWERGFAPTAALDSLVQRLAVVGHAICRTEGVRDTDPELTRVGARLFGSPEPQALTSAVRFCQVEGVEAEADRIAAEVAEALEQGSLGHEVAVVFRDPARHISQLAAAFDHLGIAADYDVLTPFSDASFGSAFLQAIRFVGTGDVTALLGFTRSACAGMPQTAQEHFEYEVRAKGLRSPERITQELAILSSRTASMISVLEEAYHDGLRAEEAERITDVALEMLGYAHGGRSDAEAIGRDADVRAVGVLTSVLKDAVSFGDPTIAVRAFERGLLQSMVGPGVVERDGRVQVTSVERVRARRFDVVILGGLEAGEFPAIEDDPFSAGGAASRLLGSYGVPIEHGAGFDHERLLLYQTVTRPKRRLVLVRQSTDSDGATSMPSVFWEELLDFYRPANEDAGVPDGVIEAGAADCGLSPNSSSSERRALRTAAMCGKGDVDLRVAMALRRAAGDPGHLTDPEAQASLADRNLFSASEIEVYLACPLRWFYEWVVNPEKLDFEFGARERGRLAHEVLKRTYEAIKSELPQGRVTPTVAEQALRLAGDIGSRVMANQPPAGGFEEEQERRELQEAIARLIERDATQLPLAFKPTLLEWSFGGDEGVDLGDFRLRGRVDRVDSDGERAVVIDYKSGNAPARARLIDEGRIQAQLYAEIVRRETGMRPVGSIYWSLKGGKPRGLVDAEVLDPETFTSTDCSDENRLQCDIEQALALASQAVEGIRAGRIKADPKVGACEWCAAQALCGRVER